VLAVAAICSESPWGAGAPGSGERWGCPWWTLEALGPSSEGAEAEHTLLGTEAPEGARASRAFWLTFFLEGSAGFCDRVYLERSWRT
jgi:hypothetical protein